MAILANLPGVEVAITVNGKRVKEYLAIDMQDGPRTATRYIEASSNQKFAVKCRVLGGFEYKGDCMSFETLVDGVSASCSIISMRNTEAGAATLTEKGVCEGNKLRRFKFSAIETVDPDGLPHDVDVASVKSFGTIRVVVCHEKEVPHSGHQFDMEVKLPEMGMLSEKALKGQALSHSVSLAPAVKCKAQPTWFTEPVSDEEDHPAGVFEFCYRSLEALKTLSIILRTPSPIPLEDRDPDTLSPEETRQLLKKIQEEKATWMRLKREHRNDERRARKKPRSVSNSTVLELDDDGNFHETATDIPGKVSPKKVIDLTE
ncbi:hypothetical protein LTR66_008626 [Elasticomyces elasticus]|nr:hypothetical protein LTR66_008626 [Elasticomyces elasticus]